MKLNVLSAALAAALLGMAAPFALFPIAATPALAAADCSAWTAASQEDEGGPALTATVCASDADKSPMLSLQCFGRANLRYDLGDKLGDIDPGTTARFSFTVGAATLTRKLNFEEMDGAFALDLDKSDPLLALLRSGHDLDVTDAAGKLPAHGFSLAGSSAAIGAVLAQCGKAAASQDDGD